MKKQKMPTFKCPSANPRSGECCTSTYPYPVRLNPVEIHGRFEGADDPMSVLFFCAWGKGKSLCFSLWFVKAICFLCWRIFRTASCEKTRSTSIDSGAIQSSRFKSSLRVTIWASSTYRFYNSPCSAQPILVSKTTPMLHRDGTRSAPPC